MQPRGQQAVLAATTLRPALYTPLLPPLAWFCSRIILKSFVVRSSVSDNRSSNDDKVCVRRSICPIMWSNAFCKRSSRCLSPLESELRGSAGTFADRRDAEGSDCAAAAAVDGLLLPAPTKPDDGLLGNTCKDCHKHQFHSKCQIRLWRFKLHTHPK